MLQFTQILNSFQHQADRGNLPNEKSVRETLDENGGIWPTKNGGFWSTESWKPFAEKSVELAKDGRLGLTPEQISLIEMEANRVTEMLVDSKRLIDLSLLRKML